MEEEKAADYYDELVRKGGNAARFKQGLGFGTHTSSVSYEAYGSLSNFVKEASPGRAGALHKEIRIESIRDKLKKKESRSSPYSRGGSPSDDGKDKELARRKSPDSRRRSSSSERTKRASVRRKSPYTDGRARSRSPTRTRRSARKVSRSPSDDDGRKSPYNHESHRRNGEGSGRRRRSSSSERSRRKRASVRRKSPKEGRARSRSPTRRSTARKISTSPSDGDQDGKGNGKFGTVAGESNRKRLERREQSIHSDSSGKTSQRSRKRSRRSGRNRSISLSDDSRSRLRNKSSSSRRKRSPSRSYERRSRDRSRSRSRERTGDSRSRPRNKSSSSRAKRSRSRSYEGRSRRDKSRSRSRSRERRDAGYRRGYRRERAYSPDGFRRGRRRSRSPPSYRSPYTVDRRIEDSREKRRSSGEYRGGKPEAAAQSRGSRAKENNAPERDYARLIPNFDSMAPAEKIKAKMKLQLSEIVVKDQGNGVSDEWERFDFDKNAPLDDDAKLDYFGDGTGATDDTVFLKNTGTSYVSSSTQVKREALVTAKHEEAIFGPAEGLLAKRVELEIDTEAVVGMKGHDGGGARPSDLGDSSRIVNGEGKDLKTALVPVNSVVSEQVIAMQGAGSWQERARKMREAREAALAS